MSEHPSKRRLTRFLIRWGIRPVLVVVTILATLLLVQAFASRKMPDLETWHRVIPADFTAADLDTGFDLEQSLRFERRLVY